MGFVDLNNAQVVGGATKVNIDSPTTGFGELQVSQLNAQAQGDFVYNVANEQIFVTSSFSGGSVSFASGMCELNSGTNPSGSATIQTRRGLKYRAGQGSLMRATALFDTPDAGNAQFIGVGTAESGYFVGYFGENYGILHSETGQREIRKYTVSSGANTGNVTVTLDGDSVVVPMVGGSDPARTAYQLSNADYSQLGKGGWLASAVSSSVYFISARSNSTSTGSYSASGATIAGTFTRTKAGLAQTNTFIPSSSFNIDTLDGQGPSRMIIDPQKGNVYEISYQYLGFGNAFFSVEDPETGKFTPVHTIKNANKRTTPVLKNPNASVLVTSANIGGTASKTSKTVSIASFVEGPTVPLDPRFSKGFLIPTVNSVTFLPIAMFQVNRTFNEESCFGEIDLTRLSLSNETNQKTLEIGLFLDVTVSGDVDLQPVDGTSSIVSYAELSTSANAIVNIANLTPFHRTIAVGGSTSTEDLESLKMVIQNGGTLVVGVRGNNAQGRTAISWFEQQ
jgi:hypothetical protein